MTELFDRAWSVTIDTFKTTEHDVAFKIEKTLKSEPNKCELAIYNLSQDQRTQIEELNPPTKAGSSLTKAKQREHRALRGIPVKIEAGYGKELSLLWLGDLRTAKSERNGPDWVTTLESGDGEKAWQNARMNVSYGPKTPVTTALRAMVRALGVGEGNIAHVLHTMSLNGVGKLIPRGTVFSGPVSDELTNFARSADLEWSIQDGAIQFIDRGKALDGEAVRLTPDTGMLGSPTVDVDGILTIEMLMIPDVRPGRLIVVDAARVKGNYRIEKATWEADTSSDAWKITCQARRY